MQAAFPLELVAAPQASQADAGVGQPPGTHQLGLGDAELLEAACRPGLLNSAICTARIDIDRLAQQFGDALAQRRMVGFAARPAHVAPRCSRALRSTTLNPPSAESWRSRPARSARQAPTPPAAAQGKEHENPRGCNGVVRSGCERTKLRRGSRAVAAQGPLVRKAAGPAAAKQGCADSARSTGSRARGRQAERHAAGRAGACAEASPRPTCAASS